MRFQCRQRFPFLDDGDPVFIGVLVAQISGSINCWSIFNTAVFLQNSRNDEVELPQEIGPVSGSTVYRGDDSNHLTSVSFATSETVNGVEEG